MFDGHGFGFGGGFMWLLWIAIAVLVVWLVKAGVASNHRPDQDKTPLQILEERLARGEIDEQEFERKRRLLNK